MIVMMVVRIMVTVSGKIFHDRDVTVQPFHPDKCGGLHQLRDYALSLSYMLAIFGLGIVLWLYISSQAVDNCTAGVENKTDSEVLKYEQCRDQLEDIGIIYTEGGSTKINRDLAVSEQPVVYSSVYTDYEQAAELNPALWFYVFAYVVLAPLIFFGTLQTAHGPMKNSKIQNLRSLSDKFNAEYKEVHREMLTGDAANRKGRLEQLLQLRGFYEITESFPVWPWDLASLRSFATAVSSPLILTVITVAIQQAFQRS